MPRKKAKAKPNNRVIVIIIAIILLGAIIYYISNNNRPANDTYIATVSGKKIYNSEIQNYLREAFNAPGNFDLTALPATQQKSLIEQYVLEQKLVKQAQKSGIHKDPEIAHKIKSSHDKIIKEAFLAKMAENAATRSEIEAEYKRLSDKLTTELEGKKEARAKHILVKEKSEADRISSKLRNNSESFENLAKEKSIDTVSAQKGGDLGYFTKGNMVPEFENKVFSMKVGQTSKPFKSQFGWHIVKLVDVRDAQVPELDEMYNQLKREISYKAINEYLTTLKQDLTVELVSTKEAPKAEEVSADSEAKSETKVN